MYLIGDQPPYVDQLRQALQAIPAQLLSGMAPSRQPLQLSPAALLQDWMRNDEVYLIQRGPLRVVLDQRALFQLDEGDLIGLGRPLDLPTLNYESEADVLVQPYDREAFLTAATATPAQRDALLRYMLGQQSLLAQALIRLKPPVTQPATGFRRYAAGEVIIRQGDSAEHVFVITEGHAEAWVDGCKVGEVCQDEIVGALAVFTHTPRTASVIAKTSCAVLVIPQDQFVSLMETTPRIAHSLIENMARHINTLNKEVTRLRSAAEQPSASN
ncbi:cyclic nucleotide-binding domain-containing protein [Pseudomonas oryzihabitans]|jgi:hypothetical protein|uniref:cyclic nucleotide-binding domain-containing protein n=1 Tax=Pseudomonas oryzihabitans TaxID=47885 RepID=UPI002B1E7F6E|nr:cyclic nucleotide-binding domain-containing protein [Pseudomonas oryzihabitans]